MLSLTNGGQLQSQQEYKKKFWEELMAYFPSYYMDLAENEVFSNSSNVACVFIAALKL
jgi:hypothetical protein